ncbi:membrane protein insertase YidC [Nocardiopsis sp. RSe5-2]|uniref:Membrane protein insertase YidC n=1 Tax=Nocardiopsis endophytica TaxID=3018445 RepID=A0ABT4UAY1_9ACTN|nr:membrane protein insertase YidC [Nocardiopsis endophytica]MDA2814127.1 membrane protein insertase YidC [Nocardiopsis endophytica]
MYTFGPIAAAIAAASTAVSAITALLAPLFGGAAAAAAVIALTILVRLAVLPLSRAQVRAEKQRARLAPRIRELQRKHGKNPQRLVEEQQRVYAEEGTTPLAGCLPMLAQTPVFLVLYGLFISPEVSGGPNGLLEHTLGPVPLGATLTDALAAGPGAVAVFAVLIAAVAAAAWASRRWLTLPAMRQAGPGADGGGRDGAPALPGMGVMTYLPFMTVAVAAVVPLAAGLYLATSTAWAVGERLLLRRLVKA